MAAVAELRHGPPMGYARRAEGRSPDRAGDEAINRGNEPEHTVKEATDREATEQEAFERA